MADFKGRKKGEVPCPKHGDFFGGSGHGSESSCQISAYYKVFPGLHVFRQISTGLFICQAAWAKGTAKILLVAQLKKHHKLQTRNSKMQIAQYKFGEALINSTDKQLFQICMFLKSMCLAIQSIILQNYLPLMSVATIKQKKHKNNIY